jgi:hypothetical protein
LPTDFRRRRPVRVRIPVGPPPSTEGKSGRFTLREITVKKRIDGQPLAHSTFLLAGWVRGKRYRKQFKSRELALRRLDGRPHSLCFYVEFALANFREPVTQKALEEAVAEFLVIKGHELEQDPLASVGSNPPLSAI